MDPTGNYMLLLCFSNTKLSFSQLTNQHPSANETSGKRSHRFRTGSWKARTKGTWIRCSRDLKGAKFVNISSTFMLTAPFCSRGFGVFFFFGGGYLNTERNKVFGALGASTFHRLDIQNRQGDRMTSRFFSSVQVVTSFLLLEAFHQTWYLI